MTDTLTQQLAAQKRRYEEAKLRGDTATMEAAHQEANRLRAMGASEAAANKMVYGRESGYYAGWSPSRSTTTSSRLTGAYQRALQHVQYFGSPEEYARQIVSKGPSRLSDLAAAKAFVAARPDLFSQEAALSILTYGLPTYSDTGDILGPTHILAGSNWGIGGNTLFLPSAQQAESRLYIEHTPVGTVGVWANPITGQVSTSAPKELKAATGIPELPPYWQQQMQEQLQQQTQEQLQQQMQEQLQQQMQYQQQLVPSIQQLQAEIVPYINELERIAQSANVETAPVVMSAYNQIIGMIDRVQADLIGRYEQMGQGIDPATQAALASLRETVKQQRENLMEEMSRRGLLQSGIWLEMESRLNQGLLTAEQRLLANRLSQLQDQLNQALASLASARIQAAQWLGTEQIRQAEAAAQRRQQAIAALSQAYQNIVDRLAQAAMEQQRLAWERERFYTPTWEQQARITGVIPPLYPGDPSAVIRQAQAEWWDAYNRGDEEGMRRAHEKAEAARAAAGWPSGGESGALTEHLMTPAGLPTWERQRAERDWEEQWRRALLASIAKQQLQASRGSATGSTRSPTLTEIRAGETGRAMTAVANALDQGAPLEAVIADIYRQAGQLIARGVDPDKLTEYARNYTMYQQLGSTPFEDTSSADGRTSLWNTISKWLSELPNVFAYPQP